jgi:hypothetical protein
LQALVGLRPWMSRALDEPAALHDVRPFESQADVRKVAEVLARLTVRIAIAEALGANLVGDDGLDDHARTAMVRVMLGQDAVATPLSSEELGAFRATFHGDELDDDLGERAAVAMAALLDAHHVSAGREQLAGLTAGWLPDLERAFAPLPAPIDVRFVEGVRVR